MKRTRIVTRGALLATAALAVGTFGVANATTPPDDSAPADTMTMESTPTDSASAAPQTQLDPTTAIDINAQPRDALQEGGELRLAISSLADNWNPNHPLGNELDYSTVLGPMSYHVWNFDETATATLDTDYVLESSASDTGPGEPFVVTYKLNPEAVWNTGDPIDVADYQAYWNALKGEDEEFQVVASEGYDLITSVEQGADEFEVVITFGDIYPDYQALFDVLTPAESYADAATYNDGWGEINPDWFTGPFILDSVDDTQGIVTEVPNPNWWGEPALLDQIIFRVVSPDAVPTSYGNGEIDTFDIGVDPNGFDIASGTPGGVVRAAAGPNWRHITFNTTAGLLTDQTIRQAIVRSLDRAEIGVSDLAGIPWPAQELNNHVFVENQAGYVDNAGDFRYDPERAAADLEAAGWVLGDDGVRVKDGERLVVQFSRLVGVPVSENEATLVQAQLADVGIEVEIVDVPVEDFGNVLEGRDFELIAFTWVGTPFPFRFDQIFGNGSDSNYSNSEIEGFDELVAQAGATTDFDERVAIANQADALLWDYVSTLPLYQRPELVASRDDLANYGAFGFYTPVQWEDVGYTG